MKFNEKFSDAVAINVAGTKKVLDLALGMKNLKVRTRFHVLSEIVFKIHSILQAFLHVSTLYSNCNRKTIDEKVYEQDIAYEAVLKVSGCNIENKIYFVNFFLYFS